MKAAERLYLTAERDALVREGDTAAAFLYAAPGDEIPESAAEMFGLVDGGLPPSLAEMCDAVAAKAAAEEAAHLEAEAKTEPDPVAPDAPDAAKEGDAGENKEAAPGDNKDAKPGKVKGD